MLSETYRYDFPAGGGDPFDAAAEGTFFAFADKFSNTAIRPQQITDRLIEYVPVGYKSISVCRRLTLIESGLIAAEWPFEDLPPNANDRLSGKFCISADRPQERYVPTLKRTTKVFSVHRPDTEGIGIETATWNSFDECRAVAIDYGRANDANLLVSVIVYFIPWH